MSRTFQQVDQELHDHESPYYRWCAIGCSANPMENPEWVAKRAALIEEWKEKCPWGKDLEPDEVPWWKRTFKL